VIADPQRIRARLLEIGKEIDPRKCFPTLVPEAADLIYQSPYAFCLATCLDRGMKAEVIWTIPYWIRQALGHLEPRRVYVLPMARVEALVGQLPKRPRYVNDAPRTIHEITATIVERFDGDATRIWQGKRAVDVIKTFQSVHGVGPGIANMAVLLLERGFGVRFPDHARMDIKPDVHTTRVLYRLGVATNIGERDAIEAARSLNPSYPGEVDFPLWVIGREWCGAAEPLCSRCPLAAVCPRQGTR
jgi:endonuclease III